MQERPALRIAVVEKLPPLEAFALPQVPPTEEFVWFPDTLPCEVEPKVVAYRIGEPIEAARPFRRHAPKPWWVRWRRATMRYLSNLWSALRGEGL